MKKNSLLMSFILTLSFILQTSAQEEVPKELLLSSLNSVAHLKLENEQITQLMEDELRPLGRKNKLLKPIIKD
jgi:hypothetical protein